MKRFEEVIDIIFEHEGGYVDDPDDSGGETKYGISKKSFPDLDIKNLSKEKAKEIYYANYWQEVDCDHVGKGLDLMLLDAAVNHGKSRAIKLLQKSVGAKEDGKFGPKTLRAVKDQGTSETVQEFAATRMHFYGQNESFDKFGLGWARRLMDIYRRALSDIE